MIYEKKKVNKMLSSLNNNFKQKASPNFTSRTFRFINPMPQKLDKIREIAEIYNPASTNHMYHDGTKSYLFVLEDHSGILKKLRELGIVYSCRCQIPNNPSNAGNLFRKKAS